MRTYEEVIDKLQSLEAHRDSYKERSIMWCLVHAQCYALAWQIGQVRDTFDKVPVQWHAGFERVRYVESPHHIEVNGSHGDGFTLTLHFRKETQPVTVEYKDGRFRETLWISKTEVAAMCGRTEEWLDGLIEMYKVMSERSVVRDASDYALWRGTMAQKEELKAVKNHALSQMAKRLETLPIGDTAVPEPINGIEGIRRFDGHLYPSSVYFLCHNGVVVYVGQSTNLAGRIRQHYNDKVFDEVFCIHVPVEQLNDVELKYIVQFMPKYNCTPVKQTNSEAA